MAKVKLFEQKNNYLRGFTKLAFVSVMALALTALAPVHSLVQAAAADNRQQAFETAAKEFNVPKELLLAISYNQTRWENHKGQPSVGGGFGPMHLTAEVEPEDARGDQTRPLPTRPANKKTDLSLSFAANLLKVPADQLKRDDRQNIRGGAAVLAAYAKEVNGGQLPAAAKDWYVAVARMSGAATETMAGEFADDVYKTLQRGISRTTTDGQKLTLSPQAVQPERSSLQTLGLPDPADTMAAASPQIECPSTLTCRFVPARFAQNDPNNPADYGNYDTANRPHDMKVEYIVIHDTEGSYNSAISWFQDPRSYVAAHYVIRSNDGEVTQMVPTKDVGWHAGNWYMNMHSIGIEHEGFATFGGQWYTEAMYRSSAKLVRYLADKYDIPLDRQHIVGHNQMPGINPARVPRMHYDPGPFWDWEHYMRLIKGYGDMSLSVEKMLPLPLHLGHRTKVVTIAPRFDQNRPPVWGCVDENDCLELPRQGSNFVYLRTAPRDDAPLVSDVGLHPDGSPGTLMINDWSARATHGQRFVVAERQGDWTAVWFSGQKAWFHNPHSWRGRTAQPTFANSVTPKAGKASIPIYGRPVPERSAFTGGTAAFDPVPLQYMLPAGQSYVVSFRAPATDYYQVLTFDRSAPGDGTVVIGNERYIQIEYNHREAFVKASDVDLARW